MINMNSNKNGKIKLYLCDSNKQIIKPLMDISEVWLSIKLGLADEVKFTIPSQIKNNGQLVNNPLIAEIKHRYLVKAVSDNTTTYFVHLEKNRNLSENEEEMMYTFYSIEYLLQDKIILNYFVESKNLTSIATNLLQETNWSVGYVDDEFDVEMQFEIPNQNLLQAFYHLAEKFNAIIVCDTVNLQINFYRPQNVGTHKTSA